MALTEKTKTDQKDRLNKVVMRIRHIISEAIDNNEISKVESLIVMECMKAEITAKVLIQSKLPAPPESSTERAERGQA